MSTQAQASASIKTTNGIQFLNYYAAPGKIGPDQTFIAACFNRFKSDLESSCIENVYAQNALPIPEAINEETFVDAATVFLTKRSIPVNAGTIQEVKRLHELATSFVSENYDEYKEALAKFEAEAAEVAAHIESALEEVENPIFAAAMTENVDSEGPAVEGAGEDTFSHETAKNETSDIAQTETIVLAETETTTELEANAPLGASVPVDASVDQRPETAATADTMVEARAKVIQMVIAEFSADLPTSKEEIQSQADLCANFDFETRYGFEPTSEVVLAVSDRAERLRAEFQRIETAELEAAIAAEQEDLISQEVLALNQEIDASTSVEDLLTEVTLLQQEEYATFLPASRERLEEVKLARIQRIQAIIESKQVMELKSPELAVTTVATVPEPAVASASEPVVATEKTETVIEPLWKKQGFASKEAFDESIKRRLSEKDAEKTKGATKTQTAVKEPKPKTKTVELNPHYREAAIAKAAKQKPRVFNNLKALKTISEKSVKHQTLSRKERFDIAPVGLAGNTPILAFPGNINVENIRMGVTHFQYGGIPYVMGLHISNLMSGAFKWPTILKNVTIATTAGNSYKLALEVPYIVEGLCGSVKQKNGDMSTLMIKNTNTNCYIPILTQATASNMIKMLNLGHQFVGTITVPGGYKFKGLSGQAFHVFVNKLATPIKYEDLMKAQAQEEDL